MSKIATFVSLILVLGAGCAVQNDKGPIPDLGAGKADGDYDIVLHEEPVFGDALSAELEAGGAHRWTFELTGPAEVAFDTAADGVDTILYIHDTEENELDLDDDGGEGLLSSIRLPLDAGTYYVTVAGYGDAAGPFTLTSGCEGDGCGEGGTPDPTDPEDPWALAKDVNLHHVEFTEATPIPESFSRAEGTSPVSLSSPEWWQRWSGGATQSFSWSQGTDYGKRCGQASAIRLQAIMEYTVEGEDGEMHQPGREAFDRLREGSGWGGTMYNWTEDISEGGYPVFNPATMWAWRTGAVKFINVVHADGSCDLPTLALVEAFSEQCLEQAAREDGSIEGCSVSADEI